MQGRFILGAVALLTVAALWAAWPGVRHVDGGHYLARPAAGYGEAAAGDHLQLGWSFWLVGHQLEHARSPFADPYSFRPESSARPSLTGWLYGLPFWPLSHAFGNVWAYNLVLLLSFLLAGGMTSWWLRSLDLGRAAALVGGLAFALAPYRLGQSTGHLLGLVAFLLPALLLALEKHRLLLATLILCAIPLSGQPHLALGAIPLALAYAWARLPPRLWTRVALTCLAAVAAGVFVAAVVVQGSIGATRSFHQVAHYSATVADFVRRRPDEGTERFVFVGWLVPLLAVVGLVSSRRGRGLRWFLGLAALLPALLALGANLPGYHLLWRLVPGLDSTRVPERLFPISCLAIAALVALAVDRARERIAWGERKVLAGAALAIVIGVIALDLRAPLFGAVEADTPNAAYAALARVRRAPRAPGDPARHPLRQRLSGVRATVTADPPTGLLDPGSSSRPGLREGEARPVVRVRRGDSRGNRLDRDPPGRVPAEPLVRVGLPRASRGNASPTRLAASSNGTARSPCSDVEAESK